MKPGFHLAMMPVVAIPVYAASRSLGLAALAALTEVAVDVDHPLEFFAMTRRVVGYRTFVREYSSPDLPRLVYVFHSYELCLLLLAWAWFGGSPLAGALFAGSVVHVIVDEIGNRLPTKPQIVPLFYFFTYRLLVKFRSPRLIQRRQPQIVPTGESSGNT